MTTARVFRFLSLIVFTLASTSCVRTYDYITNVNATDVGKDVFTLEWQWVIDDEDDVDPWGCRILTRLNDNSLQVVHEVELEGNRTSYTVQENLTSWELYRSCITPILTNGTVVIDGDEPACSDTIQTQYDPWTLRAQITVIISGALVFLLVVAQLINIKWPRDQKRTFTLDTLDEDEDEDGDRKTESIEDLDNQGFEQDEDATSSVNDWNAAAAVAVVESKGGRTRGQKQWVKTENVHHQHTRLFADTKGSDDVNRNSSHDHPGSNPGSQPPVDDDFNGNIVGYVEEHEEGVAAAEVGNYHLRYESAYQNQEPYQAEHYNQEPFQTGHQNPEPHQPTYENQESYEPAIKNPELRQQEYQYQEPRQATNQDHGFSDGYGQGNQDGATHDHAYGNYGYEHDEDDLDNQGYPTHRGLENQSYYDTRIPSFEDDYSQYM